MDGTEHLRAFAAVIESRGLTAAARRLRRSLQSISRSLATVERSVGAELVRRTTRRCVPTEAGLLFYERISEALSILDAAKSELTSRREEVTGVLRIGAPVLFAPTYLVPVTAAFMRQHPKLEVDFQLSDSFADLIAENLDVAIRIGDLPDSSLKAKRLGELRRVVFGAPSYFAARGYPQHPLDLQQHECVIRLSDRPGDVWPFRIDGKAAAVKVRGRFKANSAASTYAAVAQGIGLGFTPLWQIRDLVDRGLVEIVLAQFEAERIPIRVAWPAARAPMAKTRKLVDFLSSHLDCQRL